MVDKVAFTTHSAADTKHLGMVLGGLLQPGSVVLLTGTLGAGKTLFAKGVAAGLGVCDEITSPTFTLVNEYDGRISLVHMDLYRLYGEAGPSDAGPEEVPHALSATALDSIGFDEYLDQSAVVLIEWPQGVALQFQEAIHVHIDINAIHPIDGRVIGVHAIGEQSVNQVNEWVKQWQS